MAHVNANELAQNIEMSGERYAENDKQVITIRITAPGALLLERDDNAKNIVLTQIHQSGIVDRVVSELVFLLAKYAQHVPTTVSDAPYLDTEGYIQALRRPDQLALTAE